MTSAPVTPGRKNPLHRGLPARLRKARKEQRLPMRRLSLAAGLSPDTVRATEEGRVPGVDTVEKIARVLNVEACWLAFNGEGRQAFRQKIEGGRPAPMPPQPAAPAEGPLTCEGFPARLAAARDARGLTRKALGAAAQMTGQAVAYSEEGRNGELSLPSIATVEALAVALDVSPCWLAFGVGQGPE